MNKHNEKAQGDAQPASASRRARLHALLFSGAAFGTALLMLAATEPKMPPFRGE
jgi:hypothetical protein